MKIVTIIGARPQFIKASALSKALKEEKEIEEVIIHTGQHYDVNMSEVFFKDLQIPKPKYHLNIGGLSHGAMCGRMLEAIERILVEEKPNFVLVYGDTDSTLAGALASVKLHIPVVHVEAGLRSFNMQMPEEINRILTDRVSKLLFVPTKEAEQNLINEGFLNFDCKIIFSGDIMKDSFYIFETYAKKPKENLPKDFVLCTIHRAENTNNPQKMQDIFGALKEISKKSPIVLPMHPRTKQILKDYGISICGDNFYCIEPLGYLEMIWALKNALVVITDSGGLQKEAYFANKMCLTLREETEWIELCKEGYNFLVGSNKEKILQYFSKITDMKQDKFHKELYGDGKSTSIILTTLKEAL
ncbi:non-hydrolyzing UDP-N-acetylglucosamine 2-epimerase [Helicobacter burdigaliensis]|uniref:non-hydrolyzing UDP-N-acetylglucosamine 2-epimerase n=1 Tax=Helicobacter burdigaliensis TaxID=2315334 RepID=UPI000EF65D66|nr:UDP-N-acetylglucosamine 2-epimerase (non-hydrolyzing) [Helicobacter burdigaliensis]